MYIQIFLVLFSQILISFTYKTSPTPWFCTDPNALDSSVEIARKLPSCLPGYAIDIEDVVYESTIDGSCSGRSLCSSNNKNALTFACNHKQTCNVDIRNFRFHINKTCGSTVRFFTKYRCLPVIHEQKDYLCESSTRRSNLADINLSCERYYRLHITLALIGISVRPRDDLNKSRFKCNKNTYWLCNHYIPDAYRSVCNSQLSYGSGEHCKIRHSDRPRLKGCEYGEVSNFSIVEYSCIPGEGIMEDLPRIDICSDKISDRISINRGLLHSPDYPNPVGKYLSCLKKLYVSRESRLRLFMLEKSIEYYHELNIRLLNNEPNVQRTLAKNELFDTNITSQRHDEIVEIELKTNHNGGGNFLLYFQVDSRISEYAPLVLETDRISNDYNRRDKTLIKRDWGVAIGSIIGIILVFLLIAIVIVIVQISKRRRAQTLKYLKSDNDHHQHLNASASLHDRHNPKKIIQIEHPHLLSTSPKIISSSSNIINDNPSDRETLLKRPPQINTTSTNIDNFYEEIKDQQQQQVNLTLGNIHDTKQYIEPKSFEERKKFLEDNKSSQPIHDHRETEQHPHRTAPLATPEHIKRHIGNTLCDAPMASTETLDVGINPINSERLKRPTQAPPKIPPPRMDLNQPKPSAPPIHLLQNDLDDNTRPHYRLRQIQQWNNNNNNNNQIV
ncbi:unnamed protein product [Rotaria sp. Silwood2]|nr:unnamed protein product [Rotaria sp. Silwood2]CAF2549561.1 unnamed protein product [Rotaria sp. Silwood2]CAF2946026.1 unnamed protein product [Rotaria sp. Silwood2]CAF3876405.1 unnamed protein product [Rotaria sp. Silwood2]CAF3896788.1 unnamed protein product [Rotaria sp. Silwood2]